jgi:hypothetical protein
MANDWNAAPPTTAHHGAGTSLKGRLAAPQTEVQRAQVAAIMRRHHRRDRNSSI